MLIFVVESLVERTVSLMARGLRVAIVCVWCTYVYPSSCVIIIIASGNRGRSEILHSLVARQKRGVASVSARKVERFATLIVTCGAW